jgi:photosystem II stability/assembly factor-like uncharacterized protein
VAHRNTLANHCEPYDQFAFQRSFPDRNFDWRGWKNALTSINTTAAYEARMADCGGNITAWTEQGPANVGARCNSLAVKPDDENTVLAGFSGGGIFKSTNGGVHWRPVFDDHLELCIGDLTFDPSNPSVVYAGTGDPNVPAIVFNGDGVYKSTDAGETWHYLGLSEQGIISKVVVHPAAPNILLVAAMGNPYIRDNQRGIYKSTDGGTNWQQVLFVSNQAGASDLVQSPTNPNVLYASFWDRIRSNVESIVYGPNAKVYKSVDGGDTWTLMGGGLPTGVMGRTGLAISQQNPDKAYALFVDSLSTPGGLYKTVDGGTSWTPVNIGSLEDACGDFGWYFGKIRLNPVNDEDLYFLAILLYRKQAGSNSWLAAGGGHADCHDLVFTPSGRRYWANDGGVYRNDNGLIAWTKSKNLPVTQCYRTTFNPHQPNVYWAGAQDNGIQKGVGGAGINNWAQVFSADGFRCAFDPDDPMTFWVEIQNGAVHKTSDGGASWQFGTANFGSSDRCNWDAPFFMSRFGTTKLFGATYRAYVSAGSGGWGAISPDLTDGIVYTPRFHTVSALQESPILADKLMAGTSDGNVWRREPTGTWFNITGTLPDRYVTSVQLSTTLPQRLFVTHSGFRNDEYIPHIHRSDDNGAHWIDVSGNLPQMPVNDLFVLPNHADSVLFVATDAGVYYTKNGGGHWARLGGNMPVIPVFDLEENPVRKELVAATFARGIWTFPLDSVFLQQPVVRVQVSGAITTETGEGVGNVAVDTGKSTSDGTFLINEVVGCTDYTLAPFRNDNPLNGLTTYDLVLISKHILGIEALGSPYKMIAADANRSNSITTFDIVSFRKLILGIDTTLANNTAWRFVPKNFLFTNNSNPFIDTFPELIITPLQTSPVEDLLFTAIKVGDVNNSAVTNALGLVSERTLGTTLPMVSDIAFEAHQHISVPFRGNLEDIIAWQLTLQFDTAQLAFESIEPQLAHITSDNFGTTHLQQGLIALSITTEELIQSGQTTLFNLVFRTKKSGYLHQALHISSWPTPALAFDAKGQSWQPVLWNNNPPNNNPIFTPNPFGDGGTWFDFQPAAPDNLPAEALLEIIDIQGKVLFARRVTTADRVHIDRSVFPHEGMFFWRINGGQKVGKIVFIL